MSGNESGREKGPDPADNARPLTGEAVAAMRLRPEPPRVTRLSRKVLAGLGLVAGLGIGGALIYALQARKDRGPGQELYATEVKSTPDGLASLPKDYAGIPKLGPPLPGDLGRPILNAQTAVQPIVPTMGGMPNPALSPEEQRAAGVPLVSSVNPTDRMGAVTVVNRRRSCSDSRTPPTNMSWRSVSSKRAFMRLQSRTTPAGVSSIQPSRRAGK